MLRQFCQYYLLKFHIFDNMALYFLYSFTFRGKTHGKRVVFSFHLLALSMLYELLSVLSPSRVKKKIQSTHFFYTFGYVWFSHFLFDFHETTRLSPISLHIPSLFSPFLRQYCGGLWCTFRLPYRGAEAEYFPFPLGKGDRRQAVVGFPQHILKKRFTNSPKYDILYKKHRSQERIHQEAIF